MLRAYLKIIFAFIAILCVALGVSVLFYFWENFIEPSQRARAEIAKIEEEAPESIDLGKGEYEAAKTFLIQGDLPMARKRLANVMMMYKDSPFYKEAKRIIGEQNMDMLLSKDPMPGKEEYIVQRGDSLLRIESHSKSTIQYITYINNLRSTNLSIGDSLIVCPLEFTVVINTNEKTLELRQDDKFFKEYDILDIKMPRQTSAPFDSVIKAKEAYNSKNKSVRFGQSDYFTAAKYLRAAKTGITLRPPLGEKEDPEFTTGIFLDSADLEELNIVLRSGTKLYVRK
jgi:hypothetical protein